MKIGITERGDGGLDQSWRHALEDGKVDGAIVVTKAPQLLLKDKLPNNVVVHCTITGLGGTIYEPNVSSPDITRDAYYRLRSLYGNSRVVLRIDPLILPFENDIHLSQIHEMQFLFIHQTDFMHNDETITSPRPRVRISFMDWYPHAKVRFENLGEGRVAPNFFHHPLEDRMETYQRVCHITKCEVEICGEPDMKCTGCVSIKDVEAMGLDKSDVKNGGYQRNACMCLAEKKELLHNKAQCPNGCFYCYWKGKES